jgi:hypothetical protein
MSRNVFEWSRGGEMEQTLCAFLLPALLGLYLVMGPALLLAYLDQESRDSLHERSRRMQSKSIGYLQNSGLIFRPNYICMQCKALLFVTLIYMTRPAFPTCIISPVRASSLLNTGQLAPSFFMKVISNFVPMILKLEVSVSIGPKRGMSAL